jgi:pSer/pThr/pTyr-binding forkhead associated (FHA) protein
MNSIFLKNTDNMETEKMTVQVQQVRLHIMEMEQSIDVQVNRPVIIGRSDNRSQVDVDLTQFGGFRLGLSRQHLRLAPGGHTIIATDLQSRNGTKLNGVAMRPMQDYVLANGDILQLSGLDIQVAFIG